MKSMFYGFRVRDMGVVNNGQQLLVVDATLGLLLFPLSPQVVHQNYEVSVFVAPSPRPLFFFFVFATALMAV